jgi:hypothetical protein
MDANGEIRIGFAILDAVGLHPRFALSACEVRVIRVRGSRYLRGSVGVQQSRVALLG